MKQWTVSQDGRHHGPYDEAELATKLANSEISAATPIWSAGMQDFKPLGECLAHLLPSPGGSEQQSGYFLKLRDRILGPISGKEIRALARAKAIEHDALVRRVHESEWKPLFLPRTQPTPTAAAAAPTDGTYAIQEDAPTPPTDAAQPEVTTDAEAEPLTAQRATPRQIARVLFRVARLAVIAAIILYCVSLSLDWMRQGSNQNGSLTGIYVPPEPTPYKCTWCGRPMTVREEEIAKRRATYMFERFCSEKCEAEARAHKP